MASTTANAELIAPRSSRGSAFLLMAAAVTSLVVPWLWPFAGGPSPATLPWLVSCAGFALLLAMGATSAADIGRAATLAWLIAALVSSVIGLLQYFGLSPALRPLVNVTAIGEAFANLRQRNQFATLTNLGLAALAWGVWSDPGKGVIRMPEAPGSGFRKPLPGLILGAAVLLAIGNAATSSRTGLLQLPLLLVLAWVWRAHVPATAWRVLLMALPAYVLASFLLPWLVGLDPFANGIASRFGPATAPCTSRLLLWSNVLHLIALEPWTGWGWGELDYAHFVTPYPGARFCEILDNAHNLPLHLAVELGIPLAASASGVLLWLVLRARPWRETSAIRQLAWAMLALIGLHSMLEYPLWYGPFQIATLLAVGILCRKPRCVPLLSPAEHASPEQAPAAPSVAGGLATAALAGMLLSGVVYAAWDYHRVSQIYRPAAQRSAAYRDDTLEKIQGSRLFRNQARFAALTLTTVNPGNAESVFTTASQLLHFSPEARVVEKLIESAVVLGRREEAAYYMARYRAAFPTEFALWRDTRDASSALPDIGP